MAFGGLILTNKGREALTKAQLGGVLNFTGIAVGDGSYSGSYNDIGSLVNQVSVLDILKADVKDHTCVLTADLSNADIAEGYYLREIGILADNGDETVVYAYTNAGTDAEYIPASTGAVGIEKRLRFTLATEGVSNVTCNASSVLYLSQQDFEEHLQAENPHNITAKSIGAVTKAEFFEEINNLKTGKPDLTDITSKATWHDGCVAKKLFLLGNIVFLRATYKTETGSSTAAVKIPGEYLPNEDAEMNTIITSRADANKYTNARLNALSGNIDIEVYKIVDSSGTPSNVGLLYPLTVEGFWII